MDNFDFLFVNHDVLKVHKRSFLSAMPAGIGHAVSMSTAALPQLTVHQDPVTTDAGGETAGLFPGRGFERSQRARSARVRAKFLLGEPHLRPRQTRRCR
jgi:hypothetical protein